MVPVPGAYQEYALERRFWDEFGAPQPPLDDWPTRKVAEYVCIQRALDEVEQERQHTQGGTTPSGTGPAKTDSRGATEEAYQRMRAQAIAPPAPLNPQPS